MSDKESFFETPEVAAVKAAEAFVFTPEAFAFAGEGPADLASHSISQETVKILNDLVDLLVAARFEHLETVVGGFFDGLALGIAEGLDPIGEDLPGLAGEVAKDLEGGGEASAAFELGLGLGRGPDATGALDALGVAEGLPDPSASPDGEGEGSATALFTQVRDGLQGALGRALDLDQPLDSGRGLSGVESADAQDQAPASDDAAAPDPSAAPDSGAGKDALPPVDMGDLAVSFASAAIMTATLAVAIAVTAPVAAPAAAGIMGAAVGGVIAAAIAHAADSAGQRPTDDAPSMAETEMSLQEFLDAMAVKVGGLVLTTADDPNALRPEDMETFQTNLMKGLWESVSRPADRGGGEDGDGKGGDGEGAGGLDPEDLQHKIDPDTLGPELFPEGVNPLEPLDPTGGGGTGVTEGDSFLG